MLEGAQYEIEAVKDDRARKYILDIANRWYPRADSLIGIAHQYEGTRKLNSDMLLAAIDFAVQNDELILADNRDFIVKLGELAAERQTRLQTIQIIALIASIVVFAVMAVRLTISLRKQAKNHSRVARSIGTVRENGVTWSNGRWSCTRDEYPIRLRTQ